MTRVDSTGVVSSHVNLRQDTVTRPSADVLFDTKQESIGDTFTMTTDEVTNTDAEKKAKRKKWLVAAGVALGAVALGVAAYYVTKKPPVKAVENLSGTIAGDLPEKLAKIDDFEVFKDLKMCKNLSMEEKQQAFEYINALGNREIFLATLNGNKPMSFLVSDFLKADSSSFNPIDILKKLDLGDNFEWFDAGALTDDKIKCFRSYFVNKKELAKIIENNKDIYTTRLNLKPHSGVSKIYNELFKKSEIPDDLLGLSLGFPRYDSIIFHLEATSNLRTNRLDSDFLEKILVALKNENSPYKNLPKSRLEALEKSIKNINQEHLKEIATKGSYHDGLYSFINFCDDTEELNRIASCTENYRNVFGRI